MIKLTDEQNTIIENTTNMRVNAVAGSGKTHTLIQYTKNRSKSSTLYLTFNRSMKLEAATKFKKESLRRVRVETAHSLAYAGIKANKFKLSDTGLTAFKVSDVLGLERTLPSLKAFKFGQHILNYFTYYCNSAKKKVEDVNYISVLSEHSARSYAITNIESIMQGVTILWEKMLTGELEISHDFYLKLYHLSEPNLSKYKYILFDEGQDASPVMLDIFLQQDNSTKVIVGDNNQQIYSFRYAVNSLDRVDYDKYNLTTSFRFRQDLADVAVEVLKLKRKFGYYYDGKIIGRGKPKSKGNIAVLARTNLGLLEKAISLVVKGDYQKPFFEGNFNSYVFSGNGASLYDILNLQNNKREYIRSSFIRFFKSITELEDYIEETGESLLRLMLKMVRVYGGELFSHVKNLRDSQVKSRKLADIIFSTVHKSKGLEYDTVILAEDFSGEYVLDQVSKHVDDSGFDADKWIEEVNVLYTAITRCKNKLYVPKTLIYSAETILKRSRFKDKK